VPAGGTACLYQLACQVEAISPEGHFKERASSRLIEYMREPFPAAYSDRRKSIDPGK
jgi:hypothetical protein